MYQLRSYLLNEISVATLVTPPLRNYCQDMAYFHVRITVTGEAHDETRLDMDEGSLERGFLSPYRTGSPITVNGRTIPIDQVSRMRVSTSDVPSKAVLDTLSAERSSSRFAVIGGPSDEWLAAARALDVTDQYITTPPGRKGESTLSLATVNAKPAASEIRPPKGPGDRRSVFAVVGRDNQAIVAVLTFVRSMGLRVVEWDHAVARTGLPNPYVGDVVLAGMGMADATIVIFSPDDLVQLRQDLLRDDDGPEERQLVGQARPNVFYEAGIADGLGKERTVIVEVGRVKGFSDVAGRHVVRFDGSPIKRNALAERLRIAGLDPDTSGTDWLVAGDVAEAIKSAEGHLKAF